MDYTVDILDELDAQLIALEQRDIVPRVLIVDEDSLDELVPYVGDASSNYVTILGHTLLLVFVPRYEFTIKVYGE